MACLGAERTASDDRRLTVTNGMLVERRFGQVPVDRRKIVQAEFVRAKGAVAQTRLFHEILLARDRRGAAGMSWLAV
jgi:hypothetical protein